jgi:hypothetical protein
MVACCDRANNTARRSDAAAESIPIRAVKPANVIGTCLPGASECASGKQIRAVACQGKNRGVCAIQASAGANPAPVCAVPGSDQINDFSTGQSEQTAYIKVRDI